MILAPLFLLAAAAVPVSSPVKQGVDYWQAGDYDRATKAWMAPAQAGDADAQFNLAQAYKLGRGVPMDMRQAESWYRKAAQQNHPQAGAMLGLIMFQNGDRKGAMPWIQRAAERGDPRAQYVYGTALFNGDEVAKDWPRAYALMTKAAAAGLPQAGTSLAQMDQFIPLAERQQGLALVKSMPRVAGSEVAARRLADASTVAVRPTELPPSHIAPPLSAKPPAKPVAAPAAKPAARPAAGAAAKPVATSIAIAAAKPVGRPVPPAVAKPKPAPATLAAKPSPKPVAVAAAKPVAKPAPPAPFAKGHWRIQLGAYGNPASAQATWSRLAGRGAMKSLKPFVVKAGAVTRLQAGPFATRWSAIQACKAAAAAGTGCFPVAG